MNIIGKEIWNYDIYDCYNVFYKEDIDDISWKPSWFFIDLWFIKFTCMFFNTRILDFFYINRYSLNLFFFFNLLKWNLLALCISFFYFFISIFFIYIKLSKQIIVWFFFIFFLYFFMTTFNFFLIKYKYSKFTAAIARFWKRISFIFWAIECFLFILFFYYFLNSSQEPTYMYDYAFLTKSFLIQIKTTFKSLLSLLFIIYISFLIQLQNNFKLYKENLILLFIVLFILFYILMCESYQFIYTLNLYFNRKLVYNDYCFWTLETESNILRTKYHYFFLCLIAKYWHFIFIFISWFFFLIKTVEIKKINYNLLGYNIQNLIILYFLNVMLLIQWLKFYFKKYLIVSYSFFFIEYDIHYINIIFKEIAIIFISYFDNIICFFENINPLYIYNALVLKSWLLLYN